ncbi:MAG TPA: helix-turn-helix domain-containing protein [Thermoleophilaceae bacterium]|nr:helix-turn-helix domain-containing protein [Thermoleophilaceae bacterium]
MRAPVRNRDRRGLQAPGTIEVQGPSGLEVIAPARVVPHEQATYVEMFDKQGLARYFRVSRDTIDWLVKAGLLRAVRIGNQVRFTLEDLEEFIERQRIQGEAA